MASDSPRLGDTTFAVVLTKDEAQAVVVALELRRLNSQWGSSRLRDAAARVEGDLARRLREAGG